MAGSRPGGDPAILVTEVTYISVRNPDLGKSSGREYARFGHTPRENEISRGEGSKNLYLFFILFSRLPPRFCTSSRPLIFDCSLGPFPDWRPLTSPCDLPVPNLPCDPSEVTHPTPFTSTRKAKQFRVTKATISPTAAGLLRARTLHCFVGSLEPFDGSIWQSDTVRW